MEQGLQCVQVSLKDVDSRQHSGVAKIKTETGAHQRKYENID